MKSLLDIKLQHIIAVIIVVVCIMYPIMIGGILGGILTGLMWKKIGGRSLGDLFSG